MKKYVSEEAATQPDMLLCDQAKFLASEIKTRINSAQFGSSIFDGVKSNVRHGSLDLLEDWPQILPNSSMKIPKMGVLLVYPIIVLGLNACSSAPRRTEYTPDRVIGRSDELSSRPKWVSETASVAEQDDNMSFIGMSEVPGDSRTQAAFKISDAAARGFLANKLKTNVTKIVQSSESGLSMDDQQLNSIIQEISQISLHDIDIKERYWEKVVHTESSGTEKLVLKTFSLISVPKEELKKMVLESIDESKNAKPVRASFKALVDRQWEKVPTE